MKSIVNNILFEAINLLPNKQFSFEDLNGNNIDAVIGSSTGKAQNSVIVGYQFNNSAKHEDNNQTPDTKNLFYILGRITKFVINYINQYKPQNILIQSDNESGDIAKKRINIYKNMIDKQIGNTGYVSKLSRNANGYYILLTKY